MKFTEEQIRKAIKGAQNNLQPYESFVDDVITKLTKPEFDPDANQIVYSRSRSTFMLAGYRIKSDTLRPLTLTEHGPDVRAMQEALERILDRYEFTGPGAIASHILKKHRIPE